MQVPSSFLLVTEGEHVVQVGEVEEYLEHGPGFVFVYHPALGPLWEVIGQKLRGGRLARGAEVVLEVAEAQVCGRIGL